MNKVQTIKVSGGEYAKVADRLKSFREKCPRGLIETKHALDGDTIIFSARILSDKADENSAEATGHSMGTKKKDKEFEKQETIAVGRALAMLGYLASGEIASSEEMEEFEGYQEEKKMEEFMKAKEEIEEIETMDGLKKFWEENKGKGKEITNLVTERKKSLTQTQNDNS